VITRTHNKLFASVQVGAITLKHRIIMPPLSRLRAEWPSGVPSDLMLEYYSSVPPMAG
jgi:N-ethylmaleimide reductase